MVSLYDFDGAISSDGDACVQVVLQHVEPLTEQQAAAVCDVQQSARRAEEALDGELGALLRSLSEVVSSDPQAPAMYGGQLYHPADVAGYMGHMHMAIAMDKLAAMGTFLRQVTTFLLFIQVEFLLHQKMLKVCIYICVCV